jgi:predicted MFS family arabinose efflux permease
MILLGVIILWLFTGRQNKLKNSGRNPLLDVSMFRIPVLQSGLINITIQYLITAGIFFILPIYLQMVLGLDALSTGLKILPLSIALVIFSIVGARLVSKYSPKTIIVLGKYFIIVGALALLYSMNPELKDVIFLSGMFFVGGGIGLVASQIGNVILSSVDEKQTSEAAGLQGTFQNLGSSFGTALIGSVLIASLSTGFIAGATNSSSILSDDTKNYITEHAKSGMPVVSKSDIYNYSISKGLPTNEADFIANDYLTAQMKSLKKSMLALTMLAILALMFSSKLPSEVIKE